MNINPLSVLGSYLRGIRGVKKGEKGKKGESSPYASSASDPVEISSMAQNVAHLFERVSLQPDVRMERVSEVEQKISSGQHNPTDAQMAESLVKSTVEDHIL